MHLGQPLPRLSRVLQQRSSRVSSPSPIRPSYTQCQRKPVVVITRQKLWESILASALMRQHTFQLELGEHLYSPYALCQLTLRLDRGQVRPTMALSIRRLQHPQCQLTMRDLKPLLRARAPSSPSLARLHLLISLISLKAFTLRTTSRFCMSKGKPMPCETPGAFLRRLCALSRILMIRGVSGGN